MKDTILSKTMGTVVKKNEVYTTNYIFVLLFYFGFFSYVCLYRRKGGTKMEFNFLFQNSGKRRVELSENELISFSGKNIQIDCMHGALWVTWPNGCERTLKEGQTISVSTKGKVCIQAFSKSLIWIKSRYDLMKHLQALLGEVFVMFRQAMEILKFHRNHSFRISWPDNKVH
jgi:hypothetical protein